MAPTIIGVVTAQVQNGNESYTLPTITGPCKGLWVGGKNVTSSTLTPPSGWTLLDAEPVGTTLDPYVYQADLDVANSGQTISFGFSSTNKNSGALIVVGGVNSTIDGFSVVAGGDNAGTNAAITYPNYTPTAADVLLVSLVQGQHATAGTTYTPDADYTIQASVIGTYTAPVQSSRIATRQLVGGAGVLRTGDAGSWNNNSRESSWIVGLVPTPTGFSGTGAFSGSGSLGATGVALLITSGAAAFGGSGTFTAFTSDISSSVALSGSGTLFGMLGHPRGHELLTANQQSFETSTTGWDPSFFNSSLTRVPGNFLGDWVGHIVPNPGESIAGVVIDGLIPVTAGQILSIGGYAKGSPVTSVGEFVTIQLNFYPVSMSSIHNVALSDSLLQDWASLPAIPDWTVDTGDIWLEIQIYWWKDSGAFVGDGSEWFELDALSVWLHDPVGVLDLTGNGTLSGTGVATISFTGTAGFSGSGTLSNAGIPRPIGTAGFSGSGTLTATGTPRPTGTVAFSGSGTLSLAGIPRPAGTAGFSGSGSLAATGAALGTATGNAAFSGAGTLAGVGVPAVVSTAAFLGSGTLAASVPPAVEYLYPNFTVSSGPNWGWNGSTSIHDAMSDPHGTNDLNTAETDGSGVGDSFELGLTSPVGTPAGDPSLHYDLSNDTFTAVLLQGSTTIATFIGVTGVGTSTLSSGQTATITDWTNLRIRLTLTTINGLFARPDYIHLDVPVGAGAPAYTGTAGFSGSGTLAATGVPRPLGTVAFSGSGTLTAAGLPAVIGTLALSGSGTLSATGVPLLVTTGSVSFSGSGTFVAIGTPRPTGTVTLSGVGSLSAAGVPALAVPVAFSGSGTLLVVGVPRPTGTLALSGSGTLTGAGTVAAGASGVVALSGSGTLSIAGVPRLITSVSFSGDGVLSLTAKLAIVRAVVYSGTGTLSTTAVIAVARSVAFSGSGTLTGTGVATLAFAGTVTYLGTGTLTLAGKPQLVQTAGFSGNGILAIAGKPTVFTFVLFSGMGVFGGTAQIAVVQAVFFSGTGTFNLVAMMIWSIWDGTTATPINLVGLWNGATIEPLTLDYVT